MSASLVSLTFIPSFPAGPIYGSKEWNKIKSGLTFQSILIAWCRIFWGISSFMIISRFFCSLVPNYSINNLSIFYGSYLKFIALFFDFSGFSSIAIG